VTVAKEMVYWLRLVTAPFHYVIHLFPETPRRNSGQQSQLSFRFLDYSHSSNEMRPWKDVFQALYPDQDECATIIQKVVEKYGKVGNLISEPKYPFMGVAHCQAVLACLHKVANQRGVEPSTVPRDILHELRGASPLMAPPKQCCPICAAILYELIGPHCCYLVPSNHGRIYPCALPPGLPHTVRQAVLRKYDDILRVFVSEEKRRSWSATSAETAAISPPTASQPASAPPDFKERHRTWMA